MLTGRRLLLADDSIAVQKVIDLTFSDEGMNVTTVGDGRSALAELEQYPPPDVVLADVFMPEVGGYELCRQIKENDRFSQIPVILLVSSFEPFDQAEADRVGADDIVTKPFQSIRQLVNQVGLLVSGQRLGGETFPHDRSMLELEHTRDLSEASQQDTDETNVTVLVEESMMETHEAPRPACAADVEMQTADTRRLERVTDERPGETPADEWRFEDTMEVEPAAPVDEGVSVAEVPSEEAATPQINAEANEPMRQETSRVRVNDEALLDLEDEVIAQEPLTDDLFLDLDFEEQERTLHAAVDEVVVTPEPSPGESTPASMNEMAAPTLEAAAVSDWSVVTQPIEAVAELTDKSVVAESAETPRGALSDADLQAITREVIERMSDKVVREIAWEIVPELAELLIKKRLEEEK